MKPFQGKGLWLWRVEKIKQIDKIEQFCGYVVLKIANGLSPSNTPYIATIKSLGKRTYGWIYLTAENPIQQAIFHATVAKETGISGIVINAEKEYHNVKMKQDVQAYLERLQQDLLPGTPIALSSYALPSLHKSFVWSAFASLQYMMPQTYWMLHDSVSFLQRSINEWQSVYPAATIVPTLPIWPDGYHRLEKLERAVKYLLRAHMSYTFFGLEKAEQQMIIRRIL